ncbi:hypothetical protein VUR80DRAFT_3953 [Thermomyces stellatus]
MRADLTIHTLTGWRGSSLPFSSAVYIRNDILKGHDGFPRPPVLCPGDDVPKSACKELVPRICQVLRRAYESLISRCDDHPHANSSVTSGNTSLAARGTPRASVHPQSSSITLSLHATVSPKRIEDLVAHFTFLKLFSSSILAECPDSLKTVRV